MAFSFVVPLGENEDGGVDNDDTALGAIDELVAFKEITVSNRVSLTFSASLSSKIVESKVTLLEGAGLGWTGDVVLVILNAVGLVDASAFS